MPREDHGALGSNQPLKRIPYSTTDDETTQKIDETTQKITETPPEKAVPEEDVVYLREDLRPHR
jgi:hypothetical protein